MYTNGEILYTNRKGDEFMNIMFNNSEKKVVDNITDYVTTCSPENQERLLGFILATKLWDSKRETDGQAS